MLKHTAICNVCLFPKKSKMKSNCKEKTMETFGEYRNTQNKIDHFMAGCLTASIYSLSDTA